MSTLKFTNPAHWARIEQHLAEATGERFAFAYTRTLSKGEEPVLDVVDVALIDDHDIEHHDHGWYLADHALDRVHNYAVGAGHGLAEFHNHRIGPAGFSRTDENALGPMAAYVLDLVGGVPYVAAVWAQGHIHADWWRSDIRGNIQRAAFDTVTVLGDQLRVLNAPLSIGDERFARQIPLLGPAAQAAIASMRVAVVGVGGTGSHVALNLAYLGFRNVSILDDDTVEITNLNRLNTAERVDLDSPKTLVARRRMRAIDPLINVTCHSALTVDGDHYELNDVDLIIGCLDHDGPRQRINQIAVDTRTPYLDIATGVDDSTQSAALGGRVIFVLPEGPCLTCLDELDSAEVARWAKSGAQQNLDRLHGYGTGDPNPSVIYLNGLTVNAALAELAAWISGARPPALYLDVDLVGSAAIPGTRVGSRQVKGRDPGCISCAPHQP
jgi:molybdopterin/thiamine biosynthesis adenylyltransferase